MPLRKAFAKPADTFLLTEMQLYLGQVEIVLLLHMCQHLWQTVEIRITEKADKVDMLNVGLYILPWIWRRND